MALKGRRTGDAKGRRNLDPKLEIFVIRLNKVFGRRRVAVRFSTSIH